MLDYGWSEPRSIYEIKKDAFPNGFTKASEACQAMGGRLGIWVSPSSSYPTVSDGVWAKDQGYETFPIVNWPPGRYLCLGGKKYQSAFKKQAAQLFGEYKLGGST